MQKNSFEDASRVVVHVPVVGLDLMVVVGKQFEAVTCSTSLSAAHCFSVK